MWQLIPPNTDMASSIFKARTLLLLHQQAVRVLHILMSPLFWTTSKWMRRIDHAAILLHLRESYQHGKLNLQSKKPYYCCTKSTWVFYILTSPRFWTTSKWMRRMAHGAILLHLRESYRHGNLNLQRKKHYYCCIIKQSECSTFWRVNFYIFSK